MATVNIFVSYAHEDGELWVDSKSKTRLIPFLEDSFKRNDVKFWYDRTGLLAGVDYEKDIRAAIDAAQISIVLVSQDWLNSDFVNEKEIPWMEDRGTAMHVVPILLSPCAWDEADFLNSPGRKRHILNVSQPLVHCTERNSDWLVARNTIYNEIKKVVQEFRDRSEVAKETYRDFVKPLNFDAETRKHLEHFTGREWVGLRLDTWITSFELQKSRVFCLLGGPGIGKSAIACHWCNSREDVVAWHYCVFGHAEKTDPVRIILSIAAQLAARIPEYEKRLAAIDVGELRDAISKGTRTAFETLLAGPLGGNFPAPESHRIVVIDGLDEASRGQENEVARFLGEVWSGLPDWLRLVITARPEMDVTDYLGSLHPFILLASSRENLQDIRSFLRRELASMSKRASDRVINEIVEKSEGMFLYAILVLDEIRDGRLSLEDVARFPAGLNAYYIGWFDRKFTDRKLYRSELHELVSTIVAQKAPLPLAVLAAALGIRSYELQMRLMQLGVLFPLQSDRGGSLHETYVTLMHKSLHDWLTGINYSNLRPWAGSFAADIELGNRLLADEGWKIYGDGKLPQHPYFSQTLLSHLADASQMERLAAVLLAPELVDTIWYEALRSEWQRHISNLRHAVSLPNLVREWLKTHCSGDAGTASDAATAGKLARLFQEIGAFDEAVLLAEAALRVWQTDNVSDATGMVESLLALGRIQSLRGELTNARASYGKVLGLAQRAYPEDSPRMADVLYELSNFYTKTDRNYEQAWDCLEKCRIIRSRANPPDPVGVAHCVNDKAVIFEAQGKAEDYLGIYEEALALFEQGRPHGHPEMVATLGNMGQELRNHGRNGEAIVVARRAVEMADNILLPQHEYSGFARRLLARALLTAGEYDEALEVIRVHVSDLERFPGADHDDTAEARVQLCDALLQAIHLSESANHGKYRDEIYRQCQRIGLCKPAIVLTLLTLAENSRRLAEPRLGDCFMTTARRGCAKAAVRVFDEASEAVAAKCFADVFEALASGTALSEVEAKINDVWETAEPQMRHQADCLPKARQLIVRLISRTGRTRLTQYGDVDSVRLAFELVMRIGAEIPETLDHLAVLAVSLHHRHHEEISEDLCRRLLEMGERILGAEHIQTLRYLENLASLCVYRGKIEEAAQLFRRALRGRLRSGGSEQNDTLSTISDLAMCLLMGGSDVAAISLIRDFAATLPAPIQGFRSARKALARSLTNAGMKLKNEFNDFASSKVCYDLSLEIDPDNVTAHNNYALLLWICLGQFDAAEDHFEKSLALDPTDGSARGNYGHFLAQTMNDPGRAAINFEMASSLSPNDTVIPGNRAALLIQQGELTAAWALAERAMRLCMPNPNRFMARALFCAAVILLLQKQTALIPLGQMKTLFGHGIEHVAWVITALLRVLEQQLPVEEFQLMLAISETITDKAGLAVLNANPLWQSVEIVSFDTAWPEAR